MSIHSSKQALEQQPPVDVVLGVRHAVLLNDALRRQVGDGPAEAVPADVISPGQAVPPRQPEVRYLRWGETGWMRPSDKQQPSQPFH